MLRGKRKSITQMRLDAKNQKLKLEALKSVVAPDTTSSQVIYTGKNRKTNPGIF